MRTLHHGCRSPVELYIAGLDDTRKRARSETPTSRRSVATPPPTTPTTTGRARSVEKETKRRIPALSKLAKTALPPGTRVKDIPKVRKPNYCVLGKGAWGTNPLGPSFLSPWQRPHS